MMLHWLAGGLGLYMAPMLQVNRALNQQMKPKFLGRNLSREQMDLFGVKEWGKKEDPELSNGGILRPYKSQMCQVISD